MTSTHVHGAGAHCADDAGVHRAEIETADRLEIPEAGGDLFTYVLLLGAFVLDEQAVAGLAVPRPADAGPHLLTGGARAPLGVDRIQPISPRRMLGERTTLDLHDLSMRRDHRAQPDQIEVGDAGTETRSVERGQLGATATDRLGHVERHRSVRHGTEHRGRV